MKKLLLVLAIVLMLPQVALAESDYDDELPPEPHLRISNDSRNGENLLGTTKTVFTFNGNGSRDVETTTSSLEVRFDFENDGVVDTYFSVKRSANHKYKTPGLKTVRMDVLDLQGNVSSITERIYIVENTKPEAFFTVKPEVGTIGTVFSFDSSKSSDSQYKSYLLEYRFDFDGDGKFDTKFERTRHLKHKYSEPGLKNAILEVKDPEGAVSQYRKIVYIKPNSEPTASFTVKKIRQLDNSVIYRLDASNSYDPDKAKLKYKWDYDFTGKNDIQWSTKEAGSPFTYAYFYKSGAHLVRLLVKDEAGATDTSIITIVVDLLRDANNGKI